MKFKNDHFSGSVILRDFMLKAEQEKALKKDMATPSKRSYAGAEFSRLTSDWNVLNTSADTEIRTSLRPLRNRSRQLVRDNEYAKNAVRIVQTNVVGSGIGMQSIVTNKSGKLQDKVNDMIEAAWEKWTDKKVCHTGGTLCFQDIERIIISQLVEAGEVLIRKVKKSFGSSNTPFALEVLEADRLIDDYNSRAANGNTIRMGIEVDQWGRPVAYWLYPTHPGDYGFANTVDPVHYVRVPAEEIIHLYIPDRIPQTRGVPWFHAALKRMHDMAGYTEAEIVAARASANIVGFIRTPELDTTNSDFAERLIDSEPGTFKQLLPGEDLTAFNPSRNNTNLEPFMRFLLRSISAAIGVSYESLSRDYSQSNYSSSRLALLDDRSMWRIVQGWMIRNFRKEIHAEWLDAAVLCGDVAIPDYYSNRDKYQAVRFKPRGWSWIDPTKEIKAYREAVRSGFMTVSDVIADTAGGADAEDVFKARRQELDLMDQLDLVFDSDTAQVDVQGKAQVADPGEPGAQAEPNADPSTDESGSSGSEPQEKE